MLCDNSVSLIVDIPFDFDEVQEDGNDTGFSSRRFQDYPGRY